MKKNLFILTILLTLTTQLYLDAQNKTFGNIDYPDSLHLNKEYIYEYSNDSIFQTISIKAIGKKTIKFDIITIKKDLMLQGGKETVQYSGTAKWDFVYGFSTTGGNYNDQWDYKTPDGILTISIHNISATFVSLKTASFNQTEMKRKK